MEGVMEGAWERVAIREWQRTVRELRER